MRRARAARWREGGRSAAGLSGGEELRLPFVNKCKHCPLLSRPRQRARHRGSHTRGYCQALGVFREGAALAEPPPPGQILKTAGHAGSAPRPAGRTPGRRGRERPRHHLRAACPKDAQPGNPGSLLAAEASVARTGCGLQEPSCSGGESGRPRAGNFPCLDSSQADPQPSGGGRGAAFGWRETREACSSRAGDLQSAGKPGKGHDGGDVLGTHEGESCGEWRIDHGAELERRG